ncbi:hypothetical protein HK101_000361 [Irineochytrium annulatum]|nr:hypothetical protein HK101_000361 [Irineochytrium annulatum]
MEIRRILTPMHAYVEKKTSAEKMKRKKEDAFISSLKKRQKVPAARPPAIKNENQKPVTTPAAPGPDEVEDSESDVEVQDHAGKVDESYSRHFQDGQAQSLEILAAAVDAQRWQKDLYRSNVLKNVYRWRLEQSYAWDLKQVDQPCSLADLGVKAALHEPFAKLNDTLRIPADARTEGFTNTQQRLFFFMNKYVDVFYTHQTHERLDEIRTSYLLHVMNHILKSRHKVLKNNAKISAGSQPGVSYADQAILTSSTKENKARFLEDYGISPEDDEIDARRPDDYKKDFAGNIDDCFRIGVKFSRKHLKLYADFYTCDIIVASPLGLRLLIDGEKKEKKKDSDFLSSIEVLILDSANFFQMQNWDHVVYAFDHLNQIPKNSRDCDFSRVKSWYLDGKAKYLRQTIVISSYLSPEINSLFNVTCKNVAGRIKIARDHPGTLSDVVVQMPQVLPSLRRTTSDFSQTMFFIPSYFDYVRVRNYFVEHNYSFAELSEYTSPSDTARSRERFFHKKVHAVLCTERFHFYRRFKIRGIYHLVFYGLPENSRFYPELLNMAEKSSELSCTVLFTAYDKLKMERIVGTSRVAKMSEKEIFLFT